MSSKKFTVKITSDEPDMAIYLRRMFEDMIDKTDWGGDKETVIIVMEDYDTAPSRFMFKHKINLGEK